ncbi:hypothetical protein AB1Y20_006334 [Prymnesium parvum]|uniref:Uncharacterized protein n=1 Tax=Prymnesium parvum TaxID=97485 RepID=A0AB34J4A4_PRYPA
MKEKATPPSFFERLEERLLSSILGRVQRLERQMNHWADCCMKFMPRDWVEAQGFIWADAVLASVLLGLVILSYVMFRHMLRHWSDDSQNTTSARPSNRPRAAAADGVVKRSRPGCVDYGPVNEEVDGLTALMRSSSQGDEACTAELIAAGAAVDARDSQEGFTALLMASAMGHLGVVQRLLAANADVEAKNNDGATALMLATYAQKEAVVKVLLEHGARQGLTSALTFAEQANLLAVANLLRDALPSASWPLGWLGSWGWGSAESSSASFELGYLPVAIGLMFIGFMLLVFHIDVESEGGADSAGVHDALSHADLPPRSRRDHPELGQLTARERRSLTCRLGEAYQRWNETEGQREAKLHQQRKRLARQAKLTEEAETTSAALREALRVAEQAVLAAGKQEASEAKDPGAVVKTALERVRALIDQARPLQAHSSSLPDLVERACERVEELQAREHEREKNEMEERSRRRAEQQAAKAEELRVRKQEAVNAKKEARERQRKEEAAERARQEAEREAAREAAAAAAREAAEARARREAEAKAAAKAAKEAEERTARQAAAAQQAAAARAERERSAREAEEKRKEEEERASRQAAARERLAAREAAEKARRLEAEATARARAKREAEAKARREAEEKEKARRAEAAARSARGAAGGKAAGGARRGRHRASSGGEGGGGEAEALPPPLAAEELPLVSSSQLERMVAAPPELPAVPPLPGAHLPQLNGELPAAQLPLAHLPAAQLPTPTLPLPLPALPTPNGRHHPAGLPPPPVPRLSPVLADAPHASQPWGASWGSPPGPIGTPPLSSPPGPSPLAVSLLGAAGLPLLPAAQAPMTDFASSLEARGFGGVCPPVAAPRAVSPQPAPLGGGLGGRWNGNGACGSHGAGSFERRSSPNGRVGATGGGAPVGGVGSGVIGRKAHANHLPVGQRVLF